MFWGLFVLDLLAKQGHVVHLTPVTLTFNLGACHAHGDLDLRAYDLETGALCCTLPQPTYGFVTYLTRG